jgi:hypothetical protein
MGNAGPRAMTGPAAIERDTKMGNGIGGVQGGVGPVGLGQVGEAPHASGQAGVENGAQLLARIDSIGTSQAATPTGLTAGTAEGAPRLDQARGKGDIEKFLSTVGKGIKSFFTSVADKIAKLFEPKAQAQPEIAVQPQIQARPPSEPFVPIPYTGEGEAPVSVKALNGFQQELSKIAANENGDFTTLQRNNEPAVIQTKAFIRSHIDMPALSRSILENCAEATASAAEKLNAYETAIGLGTPSGFQWGFSGQQLQDTQLAEAQNLYTDMCDAVFELADALLETLFSANGLPKSMSDDLQAFVAAKMDVIAALDIDQADKPLIGRITLASDFLLRGVMPDMTVTAASMPEAEKRVTFAAFQVVQSLVNDKSESTSSLAYEGSAALFGALREKHQGARMDDLFVALGMPAEYRKDA